MAGQQGNGGGATRWRSCCCRALRDLAESEATGCGARRSRKTVLARNGGGATG
ncbi:hypothetical protein JCGZ_19676 [Jatropha curcas]|uniref:Uncharacterized protein n=1 Tax=Jatropha curcas TaxID=180498 RepID=A0A067LRE8_JATCU|nr:hypothetical protein JCGZ_19676 [Jatropha curcas]